MLEEKNKKKIVSHETIAEMEKLERILDITLIVTYRYMARVEMMKRKRSVAPTIQ